MSRRLAAVLRVAELRERSARAALATTANRTRDAQLVLSAQQARLAALPGPSAGSARELLASVTCGQHRADAVRGADHGLVEAEQQQGVAAHGWTLAAQRLDGMQRLAEADRARREADRLRGEQRESDDRRRRPSSLASARGGSP